MPGSAEEEICLLEPGGGVMPKKGLEKYLKNVVRRGNENKLESLDNCKYTAVLRQQTKQIRVKIRPNVKTYQLF